MKIAVVGGTGRVGRPLVETLEDRGHDVVTIARSTGVDVTTGEGLEAALSGVDRIVDVATGPSPDKDDATAFFTTASANLHDYGVRAGVHGMVVVSIVGADLFTGGYGVAKIAHERAALAGPIPTRVLRASQFHELVEQLMTWGRHDEVTFVPKMRTQLVAASAVAEVLADMVTDPGFAASAASGSEPVPEVAGPQEESLVEMAALLAARRGEHLRVEGVSNPEDADDHLYEEGALLPGRGAILTGPTFQEWLAAAS